MKPRGLDQVGPPLGGFLPASGPAIEAPADRAQDLVLDEAGLPVDQARPAPEAILELRFVSLGDGDAIGDHEHV